MTIPMESRDFPLRRKRTGIAKYPLAFALFTSLWLAVSGVSLAGNHRADPLVVKVNGREIRQSDVYQSIESLSLGDQIDARGDMEVYIEALINEEVLFQWVLGSGFAGQEPLRKKVKELVVRHLIEKFVRSRINIGEETIRSYYEKNPSLVRGEHVRVRSIFLRNKAQCQRMMERIDSEKKFAELAKDHSLDRSTALQGGDSGLMMRAEGAVRGYQLDYFKMKVGEMRIFDIPGGCLLVRSIFYTKPPLPTYGQVRANLKQFLENREEVMLVENLVRMAGKGVTVKRYYRNSAASAPSSGPTAASASKLPTSSSAAGRASSPAQSRGRTTQ